jgi:hypothetical protein
MFKRDKKDEICFEESNCVSAHGNEIDACLSGVDALLPMRSRCSPFLLSERLANGRDHMDSGR